MPDFCVRLYTSMVFRYTRASYLWWHMPICSIMYLCRFVHKLFRAHFTLPMMTLWPMEGFSVQHHGYSDVSMWRCILGHIWSNGSSGVMSA